MDKNKNRLRQTQKGWLRKQHLIEIKGGGCEQCGYNKCSRCLSFHHRDPKKKKFNLDTRNIGNYRWDIVFEEFEKCDLLCMNCHGEHHDKESSKEYLNYVYDLRSFQMNACLSCGKIFKVSTSSVIDGGGKYCSYDCSSLGKRKVERPSKEELEKMIWKKPTTHIAASFGVSDKAVEKWCKKYEIQKPPRGYWTKIKSLNLRNIRIKIVMS